MNLSLYKNQEDEGGKVSLQVRQRPTVSKNLREFQILSFVDESGNSS